MLASAPPQKKISTPCHIGLHGWRLWGSGCYPPPPLRLVNPASAPGGKRCSARKRKEGCGALESTGPIAYATFAARLIRHCNEVTLIICLGLIFFLKFAPISWAGAPSKACARGPCPPSAPPPLATPLGHSLC